MSTWGYSGQVGEWHGELAIPPEARMPPLQASLWVVASVERVFGRLHRPSSLQLSWGEYSRTGDELAFHELEEKRARSWSDVAEALSSLERDTANVIAVSSAFVGLDTEVIDPDARWIADAGTLQWSFLAPETAVTTAHIVYSTAIDVWLSATYDEQGKVRSNREAAGHNRPRLAQVVGALSARLAEFKTGQSRPYPFAITKSGFSDVDVADVPAKLH